uniref:Uncharacterized protein n=1 Tax=Fagus sylvatica TaxID=28930 RepID=A0A2N9GRR4_FAGSY
MLNRSVLVSAVNGIALRQGSNKLYLGSSDGTVRLWDCHTGAEYSLNGPVEQVNALTAVKDLLFAGVEDGVILPIERH